MDEPKKSVPDDAPGVEVPPALERDDREDHEQQPNELDRVAEELTPGGEERDSR
jgi:hypothetical protein